MKPCCEHNFVPACLLTDAWIFGASLATCGNAIATILNISSLIPRLSHFSARQIASPVAQRCVFPPCFSSPLLSSHCWLSSHVSALLLLVQLRHKSARSFLDPSPTTNPRIPCSIYAAGLVLWMPSILPRLPQSLPSPRASYTRSAPESCSKHMVLRGLLSWSTACEPLELAPWELAFPLGACSMANARVPTLPSDSACSLG